MVRYLGLRVLEVEWDGLEKIFLLGETAFLINNDKVKKKFKYQSDNFLLVPMVPLPLYYTPLQ